jgi:hypothetical protein
MTAVVLDDRTQWDTSQLHKVSPWITAQELISVLSKVDPNAMATIPGGTLRFVYWEPHANEPFVALSHDCWVERERISSDGKVIEL